MVRCSLRVHIEERKLKFIYSASICVYILCELFCPPAAPQIYCRMYINVRTLFFSDQKYIIKTIIIYFIFSCA